MGLDCGIKAYYMSLRTFMTKNWQKGYIWFSALLVVDVIIDVIFSPPIRLFRPIRPLIFLLRSRTIRNFYTTVLKILPRLARVVFLLLFLLLATAVSITRLLRNTESTHFTSTLGTFKELAVLLFTCDNYNDLLEDLILQQRYIPIFIFFAFIVIGILFLLQLVLGNVTDCFKQEATADVKGKVNKKKKGLTKAFKALDREETGRISKFAFEKLIQKLRPGDSELGMNVKFSFLLLGDKHTDKKKIYTQSKQSVIVDELDIGNVDVAEEELYLKEKQFLDLFKLPGPQSCTEPVVHGRGRRRGAAGEYPFT